MKKTYLILLLSFTICRLMAQIDVIPPSPTASGLGEYGKVPVSLYSGQPNINIPIYGLKSGQINLDISLSYNSSGNKVEAISSWVGLGWSLNAGGVITRAINVLPDESWPDGYLYRIDEVANILENKLPNAWTPTDVNEYLVEVADGTMDAQPDIFYFNFSGHSGSFFFDSQGMPHVAPFKKYKIEVDRTANNIDSFIITDLQGIKYFFGSKDGRQAYDESSTEMICGGDSPFDKPARTSWYLLKIEDPAGQTMDLYYQPYALTYINPNVSETQVYNAGSVNPVYLSTTNCQSIYTISGNHINRIVANNVEVWFDAVNDRQEFTNTVLKDLRLDKIRMKQVGGTVFKTFKFDQSNTSALRLNSLKEISENNMEKPPYIFTYNNITFPALSKSQDHWGYYNGQSQSTLIPDYLIGVQGANREPSQTHMKAGILEKIEYPTGGHTEYTFEANRASKNENELSAADCAINPNCNLVNHGLSTNCCPDTHTLCNDGLETFTVTHDEPFVLSVNFNMTCMPINIPDIECESFVTLKDAQNNYVKVQLKGNSGLSAPINALINCGQFGSGGNAVYVGTLTPGTYTLKLTKGEEGVTSTASLSYIEIEETNPTEPTRIVGLVGGLRVKEIKDYDPVSDKTLITAFDYNTSGILLNEPVYVNYYDDRGTSYVSYSSRSKVGLATTKGSIVAYEHATEKFGINAENGLIDHFYSYYADGKPSGGEQFPYPPQTSKEWKRGMELNRIVKDANGNKITEDVYNYNFDEQRNQTTVVGYAVDYDAQNVIFTGGRPAGSIVLWQDIAFSRVENISQWQYLQSSSHKTFDPDDNTKFVQTTTEYHYDNANHSQLSRQVVIDSNGDEVETNTYYPDDVLYTTTLSGDALTSVEYNAINKLKNSATGQHRVTTPIQIETFRIKPGGLKELLSKQRNLFKEENGLILPSIVQSSTATSTLEDKAVYHKYDSKGNPLEVSKADDMHTVYVWGYNETYPIAKIENADYSLISSQVAHLKILSDADNDNCTDAMCNEQLLREALNDLRDLPALENAMVTTYTYDPLVGMTSQTDPNGQTTYYEYDELNRLKNIFDHKGNLIKVNKYHYIND